MLCSKSEHVPLSALLKRESVNEKADRPDIVCGEANQSKKGEDFTLIKMGDSYCVFGV